MPLVVVSQLPPLFPCLLFLFLCLLYLFPASVYAAQALFTCILSLFYVTDGNIMYLPDASRFLISCEIQHYAPVVGWGGVEEQMHNVDYDPGS
jgi:hypothetical protein